MLSVGSDRRFHAAMMCKHIHCMHEVRVFRNFVFYCQEKSRKFFKKFWFFLKKFGSYSVFVKAKFNQRTCPETVSEY
ncbi:MAG: hypothetical protein CMJ56_02185 [Planctomycetaceae bacterium]|nr:hypothetical protein [Planctomycetaceae bacterium]